MIEVLCPRCTKTLQVTPLDIGTTGHCSKCGGHISILESIHPTPRAEAPPATMVRDPGPNFLNDFQRKRAQSGSSGSDLPDALKHDLLVRVLLDLNQLHHLVRYTRNEFPKEKEFALDIAERKAWAEKTGTFGMVLLESNMTWRVNNIREALKLLGDSAYANEIAQATGGLAEVSRLTTAQLAKAAEIARGKLRQFLPANAASKA